MATRNPGSTHQLREVGIFGPNYLQGLSTIPGGASSGFCNHQQYGLIGSLLLYLAGFSDFQVINSDF